MSNYLGKCDTIEELSIKRNNIIAELNKEFADKRKELAERVPAYRQIPIQHLESVAEPLPVYITLQFKESNLAANMLKIDQESVIHI